MASISSTAQTLGEGCQFLHHSSQVRANDCTSTAGCSLLRDVPTLVHLSSTGWQEARAEAAIWLGCTAIELCMGSCA